MSYAAPIWFPRASPSAIVAKLERIQSKCLRAISGAYKANPVHLLRSETIIPPLDLHLQHRAASLQTCIDSSDVLRHRELICSWIRLRTKHRAPRCARPQLSQVASEIDLRSNWVRQWKEKQLLLSSRLRDVVVCPPDKKVLSLHKHLRKAESSALVQFRTGRNGLKMFLKRARVMGIEDDMCLCSLGRENARHILLDCPIEKHRRRALFKHLEEDLPPNTSILRLPSDLRLVPRTARWMIGLQRLTEFRNANLLLAEDGA
ncbi:hypothetical protein K3495_g6385 [Podosphaera aphanis]|nr:hypothetical protein K3495_g6385 [Podosphaera aphanis]